MTGKTGAAVAAHRRRLKRQGIARLELRVAKSDAPLMRRVAAALADPASAAKTRSALQAAVRPPPAVDLKSLLREAPLEGVDLERKRDFGRPVRL
jgi:hypothetical protein